MCRIASVGLILMTSTCVALSLEDAIKLGLEKNINLKASATNTSIVESQKAAAWSAFSPSVTQNATLDHSTSRLDAFDRSIETRNKQYGINLVQPLYNQTAIVGIQQINTQIDMAQTEYINTKQTIINKISGLYLQLVYLSKQFEYLKSEEKELQTNTQIMKDKLKAGLINRSQLLLTETALVRVQAALIDNKRQISEAKLNLETMIQNPIHHVYTLKTSLPKADPQQLKRFGLDNNLNLTMARLSKQSAIQAYQSKIADLIPSLALNVSFGRQLNNNPDPTRGSSRQFNYGITLSSRLSLTNVFLANTSFKGIKLAEQQALLTQQQESNQLNNLLNNINSISHSITAEEKAVQTAKETVRIAKASFVEGTVTALDVLDSLSKLLESQQGLEKAKIAYLNTLIDLHIVSGNLDQQSLKPLFGSFSENIISLKDLSL